MPRCAAGPAMVGTHRRVTVPDPAHEFRGVIGYFLRHLDEYVRSFKRSARLTAAMQAILPGVPGFVSPAGRHGSLATADFAPWLAGGGPVLTRVCAMMAVLPIALAGISGWSARASESKHMYFERESAFIQVAVDLTLLVLVLDQAVLVLELTLLVLELDLTLLELVLDLTLLELVLDLTLLELVLDLTLLELVLDLTLLELVLDLTLLVCALRVAFSHTCTVCAGEPHHLTVYMRYDMYLYVCVCQLGPPTCV